MFPLSAEAMYQDGQIIFQEGALGKWIYVVVSGAVRLLTSLGMDQITVRRLSPGDTFGEQTYFSGLPHTMTAVADGPTTVGVIDADFLKFESHKLASSYKLLIQSMAVQLTDAHREASNRLQGATTAYVARRIVVRMQHPQSLHRLLTVCGPAGEIHIPARQPFGIGERIILVLTSPTISNPVHIPGDVISHLERQGPVPRGMRIRLDPFQLKMALAAISGVQDQ